MAQTLFQLTDLDSCDVAIVPVEWNEVRGGLTSWHATPDRQLQRKIRVFACAAAQAKKPVVVFFRGDRSHEPVGLPDPYVFREALYRSTMTGRDVALPPMVHSDIQREFPQSAFTLRQRKFPPTIGFCGLTRPVTVGERLKTIGFKLYTKGRLGFADVSQYKGIELRDRCVRVLQRSNCVKPNFILRSKSFLQIAGSDGEANRVQIRREFIDTLVGSDYQLCVRGSANFSFRLWETLCAGRIPLFVDTDCVLPFENSIDWSRCLLIRSERDIDDLPEFLADFHESCSEEELLSRQRYCRAIWEKVATPVGLARLIEGRLREIVAGSRKVSHSATMPATN